MKVVVVEYGSGNTGSVVNGLRRIGANAIVTGDAEVIAGADGVILPGQGAAGYVMSALRAVGMDEVLKSLKQPVLGICVGQQVFCKSSEEGETECLGIYDGVRVKGIAGMSRVKGLKVPHMGWNTLHGIKGRLTEGVKDGEYVYYVHSYCVPENEWMVGWTEYGGVRFAAVTEKRNYYATQFHPEKSGDVGERILKNFLRIVS